MVEPDALAIVRSTRVCLLDFFCSSIQFYVLLSPCLCFISFLYLDLYVLGNGAWISYGSFMQTKYLCVLIHIWTKGEVGAPSNRFKPSSKSIFTDHSKAVLLLWIIYVISVLFCHIFMQVCLLMPCGHLLGKGLPVGSRLWCLIMTLSLYHWYPGSGVVLYCSDSWSMPS